MLRWSFAFLVLALVAAFLGFGGVVTGAASLAKVLFVVFLVLWLLSFGIGLITGKNTKPLP
jgi:uncharacterized membrane protein YtjA (UPF0391 family)